MMVIGKKVFNMVKVKFSYKNSEYFIGSFENNLKSGIGTYYYLNGDGEESEWYSDEKIKNIQCKNLFRCNL